VTQLHRITVAARVFGFAAILGLAVVSRDFQVIASLLMVAAIGTTAVYIAITTPLATAFVVSVETAITCLIIALALPAGIVFLPYLVVLTLIAGISSGVVGVTAIIIVQFCVVAVVTGTWAQSLGHDELLRLLSPWLLTSIGSGLLGTWLRRIGNFSSGANGNSSYESAHRLLIQLRTVARRLSSGLDPVTIATHIQNDVGDSIELIQVGIFVRTDGGVLAPLSYSDEAARRELQCHGASTADCWTEMEPIVTVGEQPTHAHVVTLPLRVATRMIGVVVASTPRLPSRDSLKMLMQTLDEHSLRLATALAFDEIRSIATLEERHRLAREIHDGIAQEVASLGYQVDELMANAESENQRLELTALREEMSRVVGELRFSIYDLRSESLREGGLGAALSEYVRQVGSRSSMTVHLSLDEAATRLRAETEIELLRIAQEAISNARKHSGAKNLWVHCQTRPPCAYLEVRDDGDGVIEYRSDSYGLRIMKERAERLEARLEIGAADGSRGHERGTLVSVRLGDSAGDIPANGGRLEDDTERTEEGPARRRP
jgi:signal transduction histidine kinase